jgi:hypothetical protein
MPTQSQILRISRISKSLGAIGRQESGFGAPGFHEYYPCWDSLRQSRTCWKIA